MYQGKDKFHPSLRCHPERSEGSARCHREILRCAQDDRGQLCPAPVVFLLLFNLGYDNCRALSIHMCERVVNLVMVAAIDGGCDPAKGGEFGRQVAKLHRA